MNTEKSPAQTTFAVSDNGNIQALSMCLMSVMNSRSVPHKIQIRFEGKFPSFANFYIEQLAEFARLSGIQWSMTVAEPEGVRVARDWHINNCTTEYLWMGDNDVVYAPDCLETMFKTRGAWMDGVAFVQGVKSDLNNRRNYPDFRPKPVSREELRDGCSVNQRYDQLPTPASLAEGVEYPSYKCHFMDTGNVLLHLPPILKKGLKFNTFGNSVNSGGEDSVFSLLMFNAGLNGLFSPWAVSYHLDRPAAERDYFGELAARKEMLLRANDVLGIRKEIMESFMPHVR